MGRLRYWLRQHLLKLKYLNCFVTIVCQLWPCQCAISQHPKGCVHGGNLCHKKFTPNQSLLSCQIRICQHGILTRIASYPCQKTCGIFLIQQNCKDSLNMSFREGILPGPVSMLLFSFVAATRNHVTRAIGWPARSANQCVMRAKIF